jgi:shikimate kinase
MILTELFNNNLNEGIHDRNIFKSVFVMGPPGSGKNTIVDKFLSRYGFKLEDIDEVLHNYKKINAVAGYKETHPLVNKRRSLWQQSHLPIIFNTTGRRYDRIVELKDQLEEHGYDTMCVFVYVTEETAWNRTQERAKKSTNPADAGRQVEQNYFIEAYREIKRSANQYKSLFGENFIFYVNDPILSAEESQKFQAEKASAKINRFVSQPVQNSVGQWMIRELTKTSSLG